MRPDTDATRPMPDKVKQAIFNILGNWYGSPGELPPLRVADVFAGSGSMGFEALSRGARNCTFYEKDRCALAALRDNIEALKAANRCQLVTGDAWKAAARDAGSNAFDLVCLDPPYRDSEKSDEHGQVSVFLREIAQKADLRGSARLPVIVLHHFVQVRYAEMNVAGWVIREERRLGSSAVTFFADHRGLESEVSQAPKENEWDGGSTPG